MDMAWRGVVRCPCEKLHRDDSRRQCTISVTRWETLRFPKDKYNYRHSNRKEVVWNKNSKNVRMKIMCQTEVIIHGNKNVLAHAPVPIPKSIEISEIDREWDKSKNLFAWDQSTVKSEQEVLSEAEPENTSPLENVAKRNIIILDFIAKLRMRICGLG